MLTCLSGFTIKRVNDETNTRCCCSNQHELVNTLIGVLQIVFPFADHAAISHVLPQQLGNLPRASFELDLGSNTLEGMPFHPSCWEACASLARWWVSAEMDEKTLHDVYLRQLSTDFPIYIGCTVERPLP